MRVGIPRPARVLHATDGRTFAQTERRQGMRITASPEAAAFAIANGGTLFVWTQRYG